MTLLNVEIKARCEDPDRIRSILNEQKADFKGTDHQTDTYFKVSDGRLKLREGNIENSLIYYRRPDEPEPKTSDIHLVPLEETKGLKELLAAALDVEVAVEKKREIWFIDNVKFHIDEVKKLGSFVEIEAIDETGELEEESLRDQCRHYMTLFEIEESDLISHSYSDLLLEDGGIMF